MTPISKRRLIVGAIAAWGGIVIAGLLLVLDLDSRPSDVSSVQSDWPADTSLALSRERSTVLLFAHPHCPCTRATLRELEYVLSRSDEVAVRVLLCVPDDAPPDFATTDLRAQAEAIPGVIVSVHSASEEARRFGVETSGEVLLFDPSGRLRFRGGITGSRGHEGENAGRRALLDRLTSSEASFETAPVFGCSLFDDRAADEPSPSFSGMPFP